MGESKGRKEKCEGRLRVIVKGENKMQEKG